MWDYSKTRFFFLEGEGYRTFRHICWIYFGGICSKWITLGKYKLGRELLCPTFVDKLTNCSSWLLNPKCWSKGEWSRLGSATVPHMSHGRCAQGRWRQLQKKNYIMEYRQVWRNHLATHSWQVDLNLVFSVVKPTCQPLFNHLNNRAVPGAPLWGRCRGDPALSWVIKGGDGRSSSKILD